MFSWLEKALPTKLPVFHPKKMEHVSDVIFFPEKKNLSLKNKKPFGDFLVGGFNPTEKYARQIGSFPQGSG